MAGKSEPSYDQVLIVLIAPPCFARSAERERLSEGVKQCEKSSLYRSFDVGFVGDEQMNMGDSDRTRICGDS